MTDLIFPRELTDDLKEIMGMVCFVCAPIAHGFRDAGHDIPRKAEAEQAFVIHWLTTLALEHGSNWRQVAAKEMKQIIPQIRDADAQRRAAP